MPSALESAKEKAKAEAKRAMEERMAQRATQIKAKSPAKKSPSSSSRARRSSSGSASVPAPPPPPPPPPEPEPMDVEEVDDDDLMVDVEPPKATSPPRGKRSRNKAMADSSPKSDSPAKKARNSPRRASPTPAPPASPPSITPPSVGSSPYVADDDYLDPRFNNPPPPPTPPSPPSAPSSLSSSWIPISSLPTIPSWLLPSSAPRAPPPQPPASPKRVAFRDDSRLEEVIPTYVPPRPAALRPPPAPPAIKRPPSMSPARGPARRPSPPRMPPSPYQHIKKEERDDDDYLRPPLPFDQAKRGPHMAAKAAAMALVVVLVLLWAGWWDAVVDVRKGLVGAWAEWRSPQECVAPMTKNLWGQCVEDTKRLREVRRSLEKRAITEFCGHCRVLGATGEYSVVSLPLQGEEGRYAWDWPGVRTDMGPTGYNSVEWDAEQMGRLLWRHAALPCLLRRFVRDNKSVVGGALLSVLLVLAVSASLQQKRRVRRQVRQLQSIAVHLLSESDREVQPKHIMEEILERVHEYRYVGLGRRGIKALWNRVEKAVEEDTRVRIVPSERYGRNEKCWLWTGLRRPQPSPGSYHHQHSRSPARAVVVG